MQRVRKTSRIFRLSSLSAADGEEAKVDEMLQLEKQAMAIAEEARKEQPRKQLKEKVLFVRSAFNRCTMLQRPLDLTANTSWSTSTTS